MSFLRQPARDVPVDWHQHVESVIEALNAPEKMCPPQFVFPGNITKRFKRNRDLDSPTVFGQQALRLEYKIRIEVLALAIGPDTVGLNAQRINIELVSLAVVVEGVKQKADIIIVKDIVAFGDVRAYLGRFVITMKCDVKEFRIVTEHY